ncbi:cystatin domain-containing protein [Endozoicomonas sp.]|uniref:cystatin domain-containing protein n=1 Tax=Endozoicomonas sp. TaxID=1892382 RepID=UPI002888DD69|nr:cystatin domain-containing protein [Endozoicomonas sp.]
MKAKMICAVVTAFILTGCDKPKEEPPVENKTAEAICNTKESMPGGWTRSEVTPEVQKAMDLVLKGMKKPAKLKKIISVHSQVVSGVNYALEYQLENGTVWSAIVYRNLNGQYSITQTAIAGLFCDH